MASRSIRRSGLTLVELMVVSAVVSLLGAQIFPAIQQAREAARRSQCKNNLKQIGLALHNYHDTVLGFPIGWCGVDLEAKQPAVLGINGFGWGSYLAPYLDQAPLYNRFNFKVRVDDEDNVTLLATSINTWRCPSDLFNKKTWKITDDQGVPLMDLATSNYVGSFGTGELAKCEKMTSGKVCQGDGLFYHNSITRMRDIEDGTSNTMAVGERIGDEKIDHLSTWSGVVAQGTHPFARILGSSDIALGAKDRHSSDYRSAHDKGGHFLITDGSVRFVANTLDLKIFQALTTRAGGERIGEF